MKWVNASERLPKIENKIVDLFLKGWLCSNVNFIKLNGSSQRGQFIKKPDGVIYFEYPSYDGHGNPYTLAEKEFHKIEWLDEEFDTDEEFVQRLIEELPAHGIDTSMWEYNYGDCCDSAIEFIARAFNGVKEHDEV